MRKILSVLTLFMLVSGIQACGLLFTGAGTKYLTPLATDSGGYLSNDDYNEISPFVLRNTNGITTLFFSSDRDGTYDIYYAQMNGDGTFTEPVKLPEIINTTNGDEFCPNVSINFGSQFVFYFFERAVGSNTNLVSVRLDSTLEFTNFYLPVVDILSNIKPYTGMSFVESVEDGSFYPAVADGKTNVLEFKNGYEPGWNTLKTITLSNNIYSAFGAVVPIKDGYSQMFIEDVEVGGVRQLLAEGWEKTITSTTDFSGATNWSTNIQVIPFNTEKYASDYNDITPFIDVKDGYKLYFASDRYGNGNYDLYRYNFETFDTISEAANLIYADSTAPSVNFGSLTDGSEIFSHVYVYVDDDLCVPGFLNVYFSVNGGIYEKLTYSIFSKSWDAFPMVYGPITISSFAEDWFGNSSETNSLSVTNVAA